MTHVISRRVHALMLTSSVVIVTLINIYRTVAHLSHVIAVVCIVYRLLITLTIIIIIII